MPLPRLLRGRQRRPAALPSDKTTRSAIVWNRSPRIVLMTTALKPAAFTWLKRLEANNDRQWYAEHRDAFKQELLEPVEAILEAATARLAKSAMPMIGSKKTMYRMHRDTRFSANKLPYKLHVSGLLTANGTKRDDDGLLYLHCDEKGGFVAAGFYAPETAWLQPVRQRMVDEPKAWTRVLASLDKAGLPLSREHVLASMPRGFASAAGHEHVESIKLKSLIVSRTLSKKAWTGDEAVEAVVTMAKQARPLIEFARGAR